MTGIMRPGRHARKTAVFAVAAPIRVRTVTEFVISRRAFPYRIPNFQSFSRKVVDFFVTCSNSYRMNYFYSLIIRHGLTSSISRRIKLLTSKPYGLTERQLAFARSSFTRTGPAVTKAISFSRTINPRLPYLVR